MQRSVFYLLLSCLLILLLAGPVLARGGNGQGDGNTGGQGWDNPNSNRQSAEDATRGQDRAAERRSEQGTEHMKGDMDQDRDREHMNDDHGKAKKKDKNKQKDEKAAKDKDLKNKDKGDKEMKPEGEDLGEKTKKKKRWYWPFGDDE